MKGILGKKLGMTQVFTAEGNVIPVTVIEAGPCVVLQKKDQETDGYEAVQLGYADKKESRTIKPEIGHAKKAGATPKRYVREIRGIQLGDYEVGQVVKADLFAEGEFVDVTGISKGKGFAALLNVGDKARVLCLTVPVTTVVQVPWVRFKRTAYRKANAFQVTWVLKLSRSKSLKLSA